MKLSLVILGFAAYASAMVVPTAPPQPNPLSALLTSLAQHLPAGSPGAVALPNLAEFFQMMMADLPASELPPTLRTALRACTGTMGYPYSPYMYPPMLPPPTPIVGPILPPPPAPGTLPTISPLLQQLLAAFQGLLAPAPAPAPVPAPAPAPAPAPGK